MGEDPLHVNPFPTYFMRLPTILAAATTIAFALSAPQVDAATMITFTAVGNGAAGSVSTGTLAYTAKVDDTSASGSAITYTVSDLDLDGSGGANDSIVVNFTVLTTPQPGSQIEVNGSAGTNWISVDSGSGSANFVNSGETLKLQFSSFGLNLNGSILTPTDLTFVGFIGGQLGAGSQGFNDSDETGEVNGQTFTGSDLTDGVFVLSDQTEDHLELTYTDTDFRLNDWSFEVSYNSIPEPSIVILGCFGLLGLLRRRRF